MRSRSCLAVHLNRALTSSAWLVLASAVSSPGFGQIQLSTSVPYTQDFNAMGTSATATVPANFKVDRTSTSNSSDVRKVGSFSAAGTTTTQVGGAGLSTSASNGIYNFGDGTTSTGNSNTRSVGFLASGTATASGNLYAFLANNTGDTISGLQISYNVKKFRNGTNATGFRIQMFYSTDGTNWTGAGSGFLTSFAGGDSSNAGFNPAPGATVAVSNQTLNLSIANGSSFYLAWNYSVTTGTTVTNAQALSVDDISILGLNASTSPSGSGSASPNPVTAGAIATLSATVTPGGNPASTGLAVSCDLTAIGGGASFSLASQTATTFSSTYTVPAAAVPGAYTIPCSVTDDQSRSGPFNISLGVTAPFTCGYPATAIHVIQGSGVTSPLAGQTVDVEGIVVGSFQGTSKLRGFYLQEPDATWDSDPTTSEGIFIFESTAGPTVNIGDRVRIRGTVSEFTSSGSFLGTTQTSSLTEIGSISAETVCSTGNTFTRTALSLPVSDLTDWERYEGMAVQFTQQLKVTGNFSLGTQGWVDLAPAVLFAPTDLTANQAAWPVQTSLNQRSVVALDDGSVLTNANLYPTLFPQGGLSDTNTLRAGDLANYDANSETNAPLVGVLDDRFGEYRLQPTAPVTFYNANVRPAIAPILTAVGGRFRAVSANVLNFFTTLGSRGAQNQTEFDHQKTKVIEALYGMNGDVYGLSEVQNFANGNTNGGTYTNAALQSLVDGLNCEASGMSPLCTAPPLTPWALIDTTPLGASNGTDAIRSAIIYKPAVLTPVGSPAEYYQNDTNRPTLAQTFQPASGAKVNQQTFTFVINHFRSKSSACGGTSDDPFQGDCNGLRLNMAQNVVTWLSGNPTNDPAGAGRRTLMIGDYNAYFGEDPIQWFASHGYINLTNAVIGAAAYSYNFGSQAGYLDHAFANSGSGSMNSLVKSVAEWHNNADEPSSLQALDSSDKSAAAQTAYYGADPWAASDHDPFVVGFNTLLGDLNDDGVVDAQDQRLISAAIGKSASIADRRMDYDGDGVITLNDYRIWATYYAAFLH